MASLPAKVAFCITDLDPGGAERALFQLVTRLDRQRFAPQVFCLSGPGVLVRTLEEAGIPVCCLNARRRWDVGVIWRLYRQLKRLRPQLIQTFLFHANVAGRFAGRWAGVPHIVSGIRVAERRRNLHLFLDRWTENRVSRHVCVSQAVAKFAAEVGRLPPEKLCVIPNGVDVDQFADAVPLDLSSWGIQPTDQVWVTVGRLDLQKGPWDLLTAVAKLHPTHPQLKLLWAGEGPLHQPMQAWIDSHNLSTVIKLVGWQENIPGLLRTACGFVLCSHWEGMPNVVLEAMAAGRPVITSDAEGISEIITHGVTGWIVEPGTDFANRWHTILQAPDDLIQVALAGQQRVREHFTWDLMAQRYADLYEQILSGR